MAVGFSKLPKPTLPEAMTLASENLLRRIQQSDGYESARAMIAKKPAPTYPR